MHVQPLFDHDTWTYTYLVADLDSKEALLIDPVLTQVDRDKRLLEELELTLKYALDTHVHADHITANGKLRELTGCQTGVAAANDVDCADHGLECGDELTLGKHRIKVLCTPGHTNGCISFLIGSHIFTGDALLIRGCGRTDFQMGNPAQLYDSITEKLFTLPNNTQVHPGHDYHGHTGSTIGQEKSHNPRLKLERQAFIDYMNGLNLPNPKYMMEAVPANQTCGNA